MLGNMASDWWSGDTKRRKPVEDFLARMDQAGVLVFLSFDHIQELIRHENERVVDSRLNFLARLPLIAWCSHYHGKTDMGGILDLSAYELEAVEQHGLSAADAREFVRAKLIRIGSGWELISRNAASWLFFRQFLIERVVRERQIASLTHRPLPTTKSLEGITVGELLALPLSPEHEFDQRKQQLKQKVLETLAIQADPRLEISQTAEMFVSMVANDRRLAFMQSVHPFESTLAQSAVAPESVSNDMEVTHVTEMMMLAKKLNAVRDYMRRAHRLFDLQNDRLPPSLELWRRLQSKAGALPRAAGSDLADRYLALFSLYLDFLQADKRTNEMVRQTRRESWSYVTMMGNVFAAGTVAKLDAEMTKALGR